MVSFTNHFIYIDMKNLLGILLIASLFLFGCNKDDKGKISELPDDSCLESAIDDVVRWRQPRLAF